MKRSRNAGSGNSALLLDTNILIWTAIGDQRLPTKVRQVLEDGVTPLFVSAVNAWEFSELEVRGRLPAGLTFELVIDSLSIDVLDLPANAWSVSKRLPRHHKDPIDRMMIAHAILADLTIVTSDATMRTYPVRSLW